VRQAEFYTPARRPAEKIRAIQSKPAMAFLRVICRNRLLFAVEMGIHNCCRARCFFV
jgi:hypothetical protein